MMGDPGAAAYLRILSPKARRKGAKTQHVKVCDAEAVKFLDTVFGALPPSSPLFPGTGAAFRRRWDFLLGLLTVPASLKLTPASLRSGGAIAAYQTGTSTSELLWKMRLKSLNTLEHYLQEMAACSVLPNLPRQARSSWHANELALQA